MIQLKRVSGLEQILKRALTYTYAESTLGDGIPTLKNIQGLYEHPKSDENLLFVDVNPLIPSSEKGQETSFALDKAHRESLKVIRRAQKASQGTSGLRSFDVYLKQAEDYLRKMNARLKKRN